MKKQNCLIIGGGPGLGLGLAKKFASQNYDIGVITKRQVVLDQIGSELEEFGIRFLPLPCDISDFDALASTIDNFSKELGCPNVLILNAAGYGSGNALTQKPELLMEDLRVSLGAFILSYQKVFHEMSVAGGSILVT